MIKVLIKELIKVDQQFFLVIKVSVKARGGSWTPCTPPPAPSSRTVGPPYAYPADCWR